jgi:hypothetical protein
MLARRGALERDLRDHETSVLELGARNEDGSQGLASPADRRQPQPALDTGLRQPIDETTDLGVRPQTNQLGPLGSFVAGACSGGPAPQFR